MGGVRVPVLELGVRGGDKWLICEGFVCRNMGECQAAVAEAVELFGGLDILLCCTSEGR